MCATHWTTCWLARSLGWLSPSRPAAAFVMSNGELGSKALACGARHPRRTPALLLALAAAVFSGCGEPSPDSTADERSTRTAPASTSADSIAPPDLKLI